MEVRHLLPLDEHTTADDVIPYTQRFESDVRSERFEEIGHSTPALVHIGADPHGGKPSQPPVRAPASSAARSLVFSRSENT